jgi:hypothetical protein
MWLYSFYTAEPGKIRLKINDLTLNISELEYELSRMPETLRATLKYTAEPAATYPYCETVADATRMMFALEMSHRRPEVQEDFRQILNLMK